MHYSRRSFLLLSGIFVFYQGPLFAQADAEYQLALQRYVDHAAFLIRQKLDLRFVRAPNLEALVAIRFAADGKFMEAILEERSSEPTYNLALESAIRRSIPILPPPPIPPQSTEPFVIRILFR